MVLSCHIKKLQHKTLLRWQFGLAYVSKHLFLRNHWAVELKFHMEYPIEKREFWQYNEFGLRLKSGFLSVSC